MLLDTSSDAVLWHLVSAALAALSTLVDGLVMFVLVGMRSDIRDLRKALAIQGGTISDIKQEIGHVQGQLDRTGQERG